MERGLYAAASAMMAQQTIQESLAQNIANASTPGFKQDNPTFKALHGMALRRNLNGAGSGTQIGDLGLGVANDQVYTDWQTRPPRPNRQCARRQPGRQPVLRCAYAQRRALYAGRELQTG